jgi:hypothetical protein
LSLDHDDGGRIPSEGPVGESIHNQETHTRNILRAPPRAPHITEPGPTLIELARVQPAVAQLPLRAVTSSLESRPAALSATDTLS